MHRRWKLLVLFLFFGPTLVLFQNFTATNAGTPIMTASGLGCANNQCIWVTGQNFTSTCTVALYTPDWSGPHGGWLASVPASCSDSVASDNVATLYIPPSILQNYLAVNITVINSSGLWASPRLMSLTTAGSILSVYGQPPLHSSITCVGNPAKYGLCDFTILTKSPYKTNQLWVKTETRSALVSCDGQTGAVEIPWVPTGQTYEFDLYSTADCTYGAAPPTFGNVASFQVTGVAPIAHPWWDLWPRPTSELGGNSTNLSYIVGTLNANMLVADSSLGITDEGRGPYFRQVVTSQEAATVQQAKTLGLHITGYTEGQGQYSAIVASVDQTSPGIFKDYTTGVLAGAAQLIGTYWDWNGFGTGTSSSANTTVWLGLQSFINNEGWLGPFVISNPAYKSIAKPTYPGGGPATGYKNNDASDPRNANFYDAIASKGVDGSYEINYGAVANPTNTNGLVKIDGQSVGYMSFGKDTAAPFWTSYATDYINYAVNQGSEGFWMDNSSGWDFIGSNPSQVAFGNWSVAQFNTYLSAHPAISVPGGAASFNIVNYLTTQAKAYGSWSDPRFLSDPIWLAYLAFKGDTAHDFTSKFTNAVQNASLSSTGSADSVYLGGNDVPDLTFGAFDGDELPQVNCEFSPTFQLSTDSYGRGLPPYGHTGPFYATAASLEKSQHAIVWYYLNSSGNSPYMSDPNVQKYMGNPNLGEVLGFEALSNNVLLNTGTSWQKSPGTSASMGFVNSVIAHLSPTLGYRSRVGSVAVVFGNYTQATTLTPGGFVGQNARQSVSGTVSHLDSSLGFSGWSEALEDLQIPYRVIPDYYLKQGIPSDVSVLILPHLRAMDQSTITDVLIPYVQNGGTLLISGLDSGTFQTRAGAYASNPSAILAALPWENLGPGKAIFVSGNPGFDYYVNNPARLNNSAMMTTALNAIKSYLNPLIQSGNLGAEIQLGNWGSKTVRITKFRSQLNNAYFYDFLNVNLNLANDQLTNATGGAVTIELTPGWNPANVFVNWYDADNAANPLPLAIKPSTVAGNNFVTLQLPPFRVYGTLVVVTR